MVIHRDLKLENCLLSEDASVAKVEIITLLVL